MSAGIDNTVIQAGYPLYHHAFFIAEDGRWAVVQQGISILDRTARRYHWLCDLSGEGTRFSFVAEPHADIVGDCRRSVVLDMTAKGSEDCRQVSLDVCQERPTNVKRLLDSVRPAWQKSLMDWTPNRNEGDYATSVLFMPSRVNWPALREAYEFQPSGYEQVLNIGGIGPATVRGLALVSEIIYGKPPSWKDPVRFSFAYGGKDGVPYPVDREAMDSSIQMLVEAIEEAKMDARAKLRAFRRLRNYVSADRY